MSRHRKPHDRRIALFTGTSAALAAFLVLGVISAVSFARPEHQWKPQEVTFFTDVASDTHNIQPHARVVASTVRQSVTVRRGDTLSSVAARVLGKANRWPILWWNNRAKIDNPNVIRVGVQLHFGTWRRVRPWLVQRAMAAIPKPKPAPVATASSGPAPVAAAPMASAATPAPSTYSGGSGFEACVIQAESGGNASAVNPVSGAGGLYQFLPSTWAALGHSGLPQNASVAEQRQAFQQAYAESGTSPWRPYDGC
jgi:hypothetical protein